MATRMTDELIILTRTFDLLAWLLPKAENFPKVYRHTATQRLRIGGAVIFVFCPLCWIIIDVSSHPIQIHFTAENMIVIVALPDDFTGCPTQCIDALGRNGFIRTD